MDSWLVWAVFAGAFAFLGFVGYQFSVRTLRFVTALLAAAVVVLVTRYGVTHPAVAPTDLVNSFTRGFADLSGAFFQPVLPGHRIPTPGRVGWLVIVMVLVFGYRELEAWAMRWQPPTVDVSALDREQNANPDDESGAGAPSGQRGDLLAELKFRLPAVDVRAPAVLPGGTKPSGLASIAENSGVTGSGLAGAIIRFVGMLWPNPRRYQVRVWIEHQEAPATAKAQGVPSTDVAVDLEKVTAGEDDTHLSTKVTVDLENAQTGETIATRTLVARSNQAADVVAGYVAWSIFKNDPTTPPWCIGAVDGEDLAAILMARGMRKHPGLGGDVQSVRRKQIEILEACRLEAGVARYELAQLYDLECRHLEALRLHARNRVEYPRFFRGRYRLAMSIEMVANPSFQPSEPEGALGMLRESLRVLDRCNAFESLDEEARNILYDFLSIRGSHHLPAGSTSWNLPLEVRNALLLCAQQELRGPKAIIVVEGGLGLLPTPR